MLLRICTFLSLFSCGTDPILERAEELAGADDAKKSKFGGQNSIRPGQESINRPPQPVEPDKPAQPSVEPDKPAQPDKNGGTAQQDPPPNENLEVPPQDLNRINVSGNISVENWSGVPIRIDVFDGDQQKIGGPRPKVVANELVQKPGDYQISIPMVDKNLWIGAYIDENGDGRPDEKDPSTWFSGNPVLGSSDLKNIDIKLSPPPVEKK